MALSRKNDLTGSVSVIDSKTLDDLKPIKVEEALQGTMSGVNVTQQSGAPGAGLDIRIRGIGTNGNSKPTVIIDGYEGDLSILNPADIKSIVVLKRCTGCYLWYAWCQRCDFSHHQSRDTKLTFKSELK